MEKKNQPDMQAIQMAAKSNFAASFFVPVRKAGHILDAAFLYPTGGFNPMRTRPLASLLVEPKSGAMLEYRSARVSDFMDPEQYPMTMKLDYSVPTAKTAQEQGALVDELNKLYPAIRELPWKDSLNEAEQAQAAAYRTCFFQAVPPGLLPFYEALSPEFYVWLSVRE